MLCLQKNNASNCSTKLYDCSSYNGQILGIHLWNATGFTFNGDIDGIISTHYQHLLSLQKEIERKTQLEHCVQIDNRQVNPDPVSEVYRIYSLKDTSWKEHDKRYMIRLRKTTNPRPNPWGPSYEARVRYFPRVK